ncbi:MAG: hypothetical protein B6244_07235 [Candidatus Cloacimonetes bacterium 4572_55]|nr:MAG: hypothetical protein B6244_07235 [Candidatus Cloacimonetes bacterium 4572_55]
MKKFQIFVFVSILIMALFATANGQNSQMINLVESFEMNSNYRAFDVEFSQDQNYLFVAAGEAGLKMYDLNNINGGQPISTYSLVDSNHTQRRAAYAVEVVGDFAYVACGVLGTHKVQINYATGSLSQTASETYVSYHYDHDSSAIDLAVDGDYVYIVYEAWFSGDSQTSYPHFDICQTSNMALFGTLPYDGLSDNGWNPIGGRSIDTILRVKVVGDRAYLAGRRNGLRIVDISDKADPQQTGYFRLPSNVEGIEDPRALDMAIIGNTAYVAYWDQVDMRIDDGGLYAVDVTTPTNDNGGMDGTKILDSEQLDVTSIVNANNEIYLTFASWVQHNTTRGIKKITLNPPSIDAYYHPQIDITPGNITVEGEMIAICSSSMDRGEPAVNSSWVKVCRYGEPEITVSDVSQDEGAGATDFVFTVSLSTLSNAGVSVGYQTADSTAYDNTPGDPDHDYDPSSGTLFLSTGAISGTVTVTVQGDENYELDEYFSLNLSNPTNATITDDQGVGTILNDDDWPTVSICDTIVTEGDIAYVPVRLSAKSHQSITVNYATTSGTAVGGTDFQNTQGEEIFSWGDLTKNIQVPTIQDEDNEGDENFYVDITDTSPNIIITDSRSEVVIIDDDAPPYVTQITSIPQSASLGIGEPPVNDPVQIQVHFNKPVTLNDTLQLTLETGGTDRILVATQGTSTTVIRFLYRVQEGEYNDDLNYESIYALVLSSGTLIDADNNHANLVLPALGNPNSLAGQSDLYIDGVRPFATSIQPDGSWQIGSSTVTFDVIFSENVSGIEIADFQLRTTGDIAGDIASISSGSGQQITVTVNNISGMGDLCLDLVEDGDGSIMDGMNNELIDDHTGDCQPIYPADYPFVQTFTVSAGTSCPTNADALDFTVTFNRAVTGVDVTDFQLETTGSVLGSIASVSPGSGEQITVTVNNIQNNGDISLNLVDNNSIQGQDPPTFPLGGLDIGDGNAPSDLCRIDNVAPYVTINQEFLLTRNPSPRLTGTVDDNDADVTVSVNENDYTADVSAGTWTLAAGQIAPPLPDGDHPLTVVAADPAGNTDTALAMLTIDTTPPDVTIEGMTVSDSSPQLGGTVDDPAATIAVVIDDNNNAEYSATNTGNGTWFLPENTLTPLLDGDHEARVIATDPVGNSARDSAIISIDTTPPSISVDPLETTDTTPLITGTVGSDATQVNVSIDGESEFPAEILPNQTWEYQVTDALDIGLHDVQACARDAVGNEGCDPTEDELNILPVSLPITIDYLITNDDTPLLTGTVGQDADLVEVTVNGQTYDAVINGDLWSCQVEQQLPEGIYDVIARAVNNETGVDNFDSTNDELMVDTTPPVITVNSMVTNDPTPVLTGTVTDNFSGVYEDGVRVTVNNHQYDAAVALVGQNTWEWEITITDPLIDGVYEVAAVASDLAGNNGNDNTTNELTVDTTPPVITVQNMTVNDPTPTLGCVVNEVVNSVVFTVNGTNYDATDMGQNRWECTVSNPLSDGDYPVDVGADDLAGNSGSAQFTLTIITSGPIVTINDMTTNDQTPTLNGTVSDAETVWVEINGSTYPGAITGTSWSCLISNTLPQGTYPATVHAMDGLNNERQDEGIVIIDITQPTITFDPADSLITNYDPIPDLTGTVNDNYPLENDSVTITINGVDYFVSPENGEWSLQLPTLSEGVYTAVAVATDLAGNESNSAERQVRVDTTDPVVTVDALTTSDRTPLITGTVSEDAIQVTVRIDGGSEFPAEILGNMTWRYQVTDALDNGVHNVEACAQDAAGNGGCDPTANELNISPITIEVHIDSPLIINDTTPTISGTVTEDGTSRTIVGVEAIINSNSYPADLNGENWTVTLPTLNEGEHTLIVRAWNHQDYEGSVNTTLTIDTTPPLVAFNHTDPWHTNNNNPITLNGTSESGLTVTITADGQDHEIQSDAQGNWQVSLNLGEGSHTITAEATDPAGNFYTETLTVIVDRTDPTISFDDEYSDPLYTNDNPVVLQGIVDDNRPLDELTVTVHGISANLDENGNWEVSLNLGEGSHTITAEVADLAGNNSTETVTVIVDRIDPSIEFTHTDPFHTNDNPVVLQGIVDDNSPLDELVVTVGGESVQPDAQGNWQVSLNLDEDSHTITAEATDLAGNNSTGTLTVIVDRTDPSIAFNHTDPWYTNNDNPITLNGTSESGLTVTITADGQDQEVQPDPQGDWQVSLDLDDVIVDRTDPSIAFNHTDPFHTNDNIVVLQGTVEDNRPLDELTVTVDGEPADPDENGNWEVSLDLDEDSHTITAEVSDPAGKYRLTWMKILIQSRRK